jgi:putative hydrolase of the HAD superfamily
VTVLSEGGNATEGVVFDLFHTLVDPEEFRPKEFRRAEVVAGILGLDAPEFLVFWEGTQNQRMTAPKREIEYVREFSQRVGVTASNAQLEQAEEALGRYQDLAILNPRKEVVLSVAALAEEGYRLGLLSNTFERDVRKWSLSPLARYFSATAFSHEIGVVKPDSAAYQAILSRLSLRPSHCAYVGDGGGHELLGAKTAGFRKTVFMNMFIASNGLRTKEELQEIEREADEMADSFQDLLRLIRAK